MLDEHSLMCVRQEIVRKWKEVRDRLLYFLLCGRRKAVRSDTDQKSRLVGRSILLNKNLRRLVIDFQYTSKRFHPSHQFGLSDAVEEPTL